MKVSKNWLKELVDLKVPMEELVSLLPLRTIGTKEVTEQFIELDMKGYNRADLLSMRGVALEVGAITDSSVKFTDAEWVNPGLPELKIKVEDPKLAPLYCIARIEGLKVGASEADWVTKLTDSGMRAVNNLADVTNLVMLEYGQPLHAFDAGTVDQESIVVRLAHEDEVLETLDQKTRKLTANDLVIADPDKALGLAGVMGGKNSEITDQTTTILLEAAIFDPGTLRKTGTRLGLNSEASKRFHHGLTKTRLLQALSAAIKMYREMGGKLTGLSIVGETTDQPRQIDLNLAKTSALIGVELSSEQIQGYLEKLHFKVTPGQDSLTVDVPYFRLDIELQEDLIEEVARMYGYEKIPSTPLPGTAPEPIDQSKFKFIQSLKEALVEAGLTEVQTYPYFSTAILNSFGWMDKLGELVKLANPISAETEYLRQNGWQNLVEVVDKNLRQGYTDIAVFEINKVYTVPAEEHYTLALALMNGTNNPIAELNAMMKQAFSALKMDISVKEKSDRAPLESFHPVRHFGLMHQDEAVGGVAEIHPRTLNKFGIDKRVAIAEINLSSFLVDVK